MQAYLDGDRDLERRRALAAEQLELARDALETEGGDSRATAIRRAGRALALDPDSPEAAELVTKLMLEPPKELPADLVESLEDENRKLNAQRAKLVMWATGSLFLFWAVIPFMKVKNWSNLFAFYGLICLGLVASAAVVRTGRTRLVPSLGVMGLVVLAFTRIAGPFVLTPTIACVAMLTMSAMPENRGRPLMIVSIVLGAMGAAYLLEYFNAIDHTYAVHDGFLITSSAIFEMRTDTMDKAVLIVSNLAFVGITGLLAYSLNERRVRAQRQLHVQAWHLRQLIPTKTATKFKAKAP